MFSLFDFVFALAGKYANAAAAIPVTHAAHTHTRKLSLPLSPFLPASNTCGKCALTALPPLPLQSPVSSFLTHSHSVCLGDGNWHEKQDNTSPRKTRSPKNFESDVAADADATQEYLSVATSLFSKLRGQFFSGKTVQKSYFNLKKRPTASRRFNES